MGRRGSTSRWARSVISFIFPWTYRSIANAAVRISFIPEIKGIKWKQGKTVLGREGRAGETKPECRFEKNPKIKASSNNVIPQTLVLNVYERYTMMFISMLLRRDRADWARVWRRWGRLWALPSRRRAPARGADGRTRAVSRAVLYDSPGIPLPSPLI